MKINVQIQNVGAKDITTTSQIGNITFQIEGDMSYITKAMFDPETQAKFLANQHSNLKFYAENKTVVSDAIEAIVGGAARGLISSIDQQISPIARLRGRIMGLLAGWGIIPGKGKKAKCNCQDKHATRGNNFESHMAHTNGKQEIR